MNLLGLKSEAQMKLVINQMPQDKILMWLLDFMSVCMSKNMKACQLKNICRVRIPFTTIVLSKEDSILASVCDF